MYVCIYITYISLFFYMCTHNTQQKLDLLPKDNNNKLLDDQLGFSVTEKQLTNQLFNLSAKYAWMTHLEILKRILPCLILQLSHQHLVVCFQITMITGTC